MTVGVTGSATARVINPSRSIRAGAAGGVPFPEGAVSRRPSGAM